MRLAQYLRQEKAIAAADSGGIRERWMWGLRLLRDEEAVASPKSLRHGVADQLVAAARADGRKLSPAEIRRRLQCARTYPTEAQIARAMGDFGSWSDLAAANFPPYEVPDGEPLADHRNDSERARDRARALAGVASEQDALFPLSDFEPVTTTLKELAEYASEMSALTERFAARDRDRKTYLSRLIEAAGGDLSVTWQAAHDRLGLTA